MKYWLESTHLPELVARESKDFEVLEGRLQHIHVGVLEGVASVRRHVDDQHHLKEFKGFQYRSIGNEGDQML